MEPELYNRFYAADQRGWWFVGRRKIVLQELLRHGRPSRVLDVGCGTGGELAALERESLKAWGLDPSPLATGYCRERELRVTRASGLDIPFRDGAFDAALLLDVIEGDALKTDFEALVPKGEPVRIIANLPYNVGTQLLVNWLLPKEWPPFWLSMTLMFQKEVGQRIVAEEGDNHYGRLGVLAGWRTVPEMAFDVPPQAFSPPPKVTSTVVHLLPKEKPLACDVAKLEKVTEAAFGQRRKMLRQSVKSIGGEALLEKAGIDPTRRAETLSVEEFVRLANSL